MYLIIGQGAAGTAAANELRQLDSEASITVITNEHDGFYSRIDLPDIISRRYGPVDAMLQSSQQFYAKEIRCIIGERVVNILPEEHYVELSSGQKLSYDKLLLATGAQPVIPKLAGFESQGVYSLWTLAQAEEISRGAIKAQSAIVLGAGLIGLKIALALKKRGLKITVIEKMNRVMSQQLDEQGAAILEARIKAEGVEVLTGLQVDAVESRNGAVAGVTIGTRFLACDMLISTVGVKPNTGLAEMAGVDVGLGIVTDEFLQTSKSDIYAAGDAAEVRDVISKRSVVSAGWPAAVEQGLVAARNMAGISKVKYDGYLAKNSVEIAGMPLVSAGDVNGSDGDETLIYCKESVYRRLVFKDNRLGGFLLMGEIRQAGVLAEAILHSPDMQCRSALGSGFSFVDLLTF